MSLLNVLKKRPAVPVSCLLSVVIGLHMTTTHTKPIFEKNNPRHVDCSSSDTQTKLLHNQTCNNSPSARLLQADLQQLAFGETLHWFKGDICEK